ncbi:hypothetical protein FQN53_008028 [Emmonsiellopsis sp. PD_33]|nr:hypothetical protein FQN53_008028 [Emmonsiellopsis sp. PD_33]KAK2802880.1 hypothetical protein FQN51_004142 [Onygenales sp. PD_10]
MSAQTPSRKPTILLTPGSWHVPAHFAPLTTSLTALSYPVETVSLPTIGAETPTKSLSDDVAAVRTALTRLIDDEGKDVVVVAHSYGGVVVGCACEGFAKRDRREGGAGVVLIVYICAGLGRKGVSVFDAFERKWAGYMRMENGYSYPPKTPRPPYPSAHTLLYHDLSPDDQEKYTALLQHGTIAAFLEPITYEPWHDIPSAYIFTTKDESLPVAMQEAMVKGAEEDGDAKVVFQKAYLDSSHSPFLSRPAETAGVIDGFVNGVEAGI